MMTGLQTRALTSTPFLQTSSHQSPQNGEELGLTRVMRDPYEWKSAVSLALYLFVASLALAPALAVDQKKFAAEINTKTLKAAAIAKGSAR